MAGKIKGTVLIARRDFVVRRFGEERWNELLKRLPAEAVKVLTSPMLPSEWYSFDINAALDDALIDLLGGEGEAAFRQLGRESAQFNLERFQGPFLRGKTPARFLAQAPALYRMYYDVGTHEWKPSGPTSGSLITKGAINTSLGECLTVMGWYQFALEQTGARDVEITHPQCRARAGSICEYRISWNE